MSAYDCLFIIIILISFTADGKFHNRFFFQKRLLVVTIVNMIIVIMIII